MPLYRKKPVVIEAMAFNHLVNDSFKVAQWCGGKYVRTEKPSDHTDVHRELWIPTLEGRMIAKEGDWIIKGVAGEFYPCKPEIFAETYEPTTPASTPPPRPPPEG